MNDRKIRVGLIRMDSHTMYIGILMDEHDPALLRGPMPDLPAAYRDLHVGLGALQCRQKHGRQDDNDRNNHQQFDQRERCL